MRPGLRAEFSIGALLLCLVLVTTPSVAQQSADQVVAELNQGAMEAYNNMDIEKSGSMLEEALRIALEAGVMGPLFAQTNLNLGIVYVGGLGDNDSGVKYFMDAICSDPSVQLDPLTSTPDVQSVFQVAAQRVQQMGCPQGGPMIGPGAAAQTMPMQQGGPQGGYAAGGGVNLDEELPPGWNQGADSDGPAREFRRGFVQLGLTLGLTNVHPGMLADRKPPYDQIFVAVNEDGTVGNVADLFDDEGNVLTNPDTGEPVWNFDDLRFAGTSIEDANGMEIGEESANSWVPDADSTDGIYEPGGSDDMVLKNYLPIGGACEADGTKTGPGAILADATADLAPSRYCVRVKKPGFATSLALRAAVGYFVTRDVSIAAITRFQFAAGEGDFANLLLGARVEYMFTKTKARGFMFSGFVGGTFGQIQAQPSADDTTGNEPWIKSGLIGAHAGVTLRYRFHNNFGVYMSPEFNLQFPTVLWNIDLSFLGAELAF
jgi:hypothetical protein